MLVIAVAVLVVCGACSGTSKSDVKSELRRQLDKTGMSADQQNCVIAAVDKLSQSDIDAIAAGRQPSKDGENAFVAAVGACAAEGAPAT